MNIQDILDLYSDRQETRLLAAAIKGERPGKHIFISGLKGSSAGLYFSALYKASQHSQLFILKDRETAEYFQNDLQTWHEKKPIRLFPSPFKGENELAELSNQDILDRTEVLDQLRRKEGRHIIVTWPEALLEKVVDESTLKENTFEIKTGDTLDLDFMIDFLVTYQFERVDFVYEPGTFSIRGGIIDIYSYAGELPIRVELIEDKVESIRMFDVETQLSERKLSRVTIIPNVETQEKKLSRVSFIDSLPVNTLVVIDDLFAAHESWKNGLEKFEAARTEAGEDSPLALMAMESSQSLHASIAARTTVEIGSRAYFKPDEEFSADISPQPQFNKNFSLLAEELDRRSAEGYTSLIFSDQTRQVERIYAIFEDIDKGGAEFTPIYKTLKAGFIDHATRIAFFTEHEIFGRYQRYKGRKHYNKSEAITLRELYELRPGDYVTHADHGVGIFSGLEKLEINGKTQEAVRLKYKGGDLLYVNIHSLHKISRFTGQEGKAPKVNKLGTGAWQNLKDKTKNKVKDIARDLILLYAKRKQSKGFAFSPDSYMQTELEASFIYEDTPDQASATEDVKRDMESQSPMDRLICGDVGFGKTEVAIRAAFKAATDGKQVGVLVPTTVLASQHAKTFRSRLADFPVTVDFVSRFKSPAQQKETLKRVADGKVDILIGTHRLLSKDIKWKDLGLLIIDEEQKFGVASKEKLRMAKANIDTLTLTATPIPRTLSFSLMGARDMSAINSPPPNRQPVKTIIHAYDEKVIREAIEKELDRKGQVFFVHNRIRDIFEMGDKIKALVPEARVAVAHAQMESDKLEEIMLHFIDGYYDVLVSTNIIEAGLDIPNANTIIVNNAQNHGLSDLYQLRGRVGRSNKKAYCYLLTPGLMTMTPEARKRLAALEEHSDLGSGFHIAMKDLDIRGAGNILGGEQSGFIAEVGLEMYQKILQEAMAELKDEEFKDLFKDEKTTIKTETQVETDLELHIPDYYITSIHERLSLYTKLNDLENEAQLQRFRENLIDRFGSIPKPTRELMEMVRLKWLLQEIFVEKASLKRNRLKAVFMKKTEPGFFEKEAFGNILNYVQKFPSKAKLTQDEGVLTLIIQDIRSARQAVQELREITGTNIPEIAENKD